jgi:hypothetical protein
MGATQDAKITLSSKMPTTGIGVDVVVKKDADKSLCNHLRTNIGQFYSRI